MRCFCVFPEQEINRERSLRTQLAEKLEQRPSTAGEETEKKRQRENDALAKAVSEHEQIEEQLKQVSLH